MIEALLLWVCLNDNLIGLNLIKLLQKKLQPVKGKSPDYHYYY